MSEDWIYGRLDGIARIDRGASWGKSQEVADDSGTPVIRIANVQPEGLELSDIRLVADIKLRDIERSMIGPNTLLMVGSNGNPERIGNVYAPDSRTEGLVLASFLIGLHARDPLTAQWLFYWLSSEVTQKLITDSTAGSTGLKNMSLEWLRSISVPIPTLPVQRRIVDLMTHLDAHIANLQAERTCALNVHQTMKVALLQQKDDWVSGTVSDFIDIQVGYPFKSTLFSVAEGDVLLLRGDNIVPGGIRWRDAKKWPSENLNEVSAYFLEEGDVVIAMDRTWISSGLKIAVISNNDLPALLVQRVARLRAKQDLMQELVSFYLDSPKFEAMVLSQQTGTSVPHISSKQIGSFPIHIPPTMSQQEHLAFLLMSSRALIEGMGSEIAAMESMRMTLLSQLLSKVTTIPDDYDTFLTEVA